MFSFDDSQGLYTLSLMIRSRKFEEKIEQLFASHKMHGTTHLAIGQEAVHAGVSPALDAKDWIVTTHRCHGHTLAKGASLHAMFAEFFGFAEGLAKGLGGSMHLIDVEHHNAGSSAVVGSGVALATGMALQLKRIQSEQLVVAFFGDGASSRGVVHESMNMASIWHLPVLFLCEHNMYGMSSCAKKMISIDSIAKRGAAYSIESASIDGNDVELVYETVQKASDYIRTEGKPFLLETRTYRFSGHSKNDEMVYRTRKEEQVWKMRDPITLFANKLQKRGVITDASYHELVEKEQEMIDRACDEVLATHNELPMQEAFALVQSSKDIV